MSPPSERDGSCVRKNAKWPEIFVCASLSYSRCAVTACAAAATTIYPPTKSCCTFAIRMFGAAADR